MLTAIEWTGTRVNNPYLLQTATTKRPEVIIPAGGIVPGYTFNGWIGCTEVSPGCVLCYARELDAKRFSKTVGGATKANPVSHWGKGAPRYITTDDYWKQPHRWNEEAKRTGVRRKVFAMSLADWADKDVADEHRERLFKLIYNTPNLDWLLLSKRAMEAWDYVTKCLWLVNDPLPNVQFGFTVENQDMANARIPILCKLHELGYKTFLSVEPMVSSVDLGDWVYLCPVCEGRKMKNGCLHCNSQNGYVNQGIDWVINGFESGADVKNKEGKVILSPRPGHPEWSIDLKDTCVDAGIPFFFKQWGDWRPVGSLMAYALGNQVMRDTYPVKIIDHTGKTLDWTPDITADKVASMKEPWIMERVGKLEAGNLLDGKEWLQFPETLATQTANP